MPTKKQLKKKENETYDEWDKRLRSFYKDDPATVQLIMDSEEMKNNIKNKKDISNKKKKSLRINLWVTEEFNQDVNILHGLFHNQSISEMIVNIVNSYIDQIKTNDTPVWTMLEKFNELDNIREKNLKLFLSEIDLEKIIKESK